MEGLSPCNCTAIACIKWATARLKLVSFCATSLFSSNPANFKRFVHRYKNYHRKQDTVICSFGVISCLAFSNACCRISRPTNFNVKRFWCNRLYTHPRYTLSPDEIPLSAWHDETATMQPLRVQFWDTREYSNYLRSQSVTEIKNIKKFQGQSRESGWHILSPPTSR